MQTFLKARTTYLILGSLLTLVLVGLGGFVRATGAGLSCPDWPLCFGRFVPETFSGGVLQEYVHRVTAGFVTLLTLGWVILSRRTRVNQPGQFRFGLLLLGILFFQIILGGLTVIMLVNPFIVTAHLALGTLYFQLFAMAAVESRKSSVEQYEVPRNYIVLRKLAYLLWIGTFLQITLGGFVGSSGASLACPDLPFCFGQVFPRAGAQMVHMLHRGLALVLFVGSIVQYFVARNTATRDRAYIGHCLGIVVLYLLQIGIGVSNVYFQIPVWVTVLHLVIGQLILLAVGILYKELKGIVIFEAQESHSKHRARAQSSAPTGALA